MSDTADRIRGLSPAKREILLRRLAKSPGAAAPRERIPPVARDGGPLPVSFAQERLWFLDQLDPGSVAYHIPGALRLRGTLDVQALSRAFDGVIARHEALRTSIDVVAGAPAQRVASALTIPLPVKDLSALSGEEREAAARALAAEVARAPFELSRGPLVRAALAKLSSSEHVLAFCMHHAVSDGWSQGVLVREIAALYDAFSRGEPSPLPDLPIQYADYAAWQRTWLAGEVLERQVAYWKERLGGAPALLELPTDRPRPAAVGYRGGSVPVALSREACEGLGALCRREGATPFMALLAAFSALLSRYSRQDDVVVGSPIANRTRAETEGLIGLFVNTLALRTDLSGDPSFRQLLARAKDATLGAYAHQDLPFERVVAELGAPRSMAHAPVFQAMLALQNAPAEALSLRGLSLEPLGAEAVTAKFDLTLSLGDAGGAWRGSLEYREDLFDAATIERMAAHFATLLGGAVARPDAPVASLPLMGSEERERVLGEWNRTAVEVAGEGTVLDEFAAQVAREPEAVAVAAGDGRVTYGELAARAASLSRALREAGVGRGSRVGVCLGRSIDLAVALLGALGAGAAYVPMDPSLPAERLAYMLEDSGALVVLADAASRGAVPPSAACVLRVDELPHPPLAGAADASAARPEDVAYVMYTSGSTGRPKGVAVPHRGLSNFLASMREAPGLRRDDVLVSVTTPSFDIFGLELYLPLTVGARVVMASRDLAADGARLGALLASAGATAMQATPATWRLLLEAGWEGSPSLVALCGGEALPPELATRLLERCGALWNLYGPTETTIWSSLSRLGAGDAVTLGRPIANTRLYVLDARGEPAPLGVPGELHIAGEGLARGYWGRPELTAERFVPEPFSGEPGARMYKTGDLVRRRPDGQLDYLGRLDFQVKLRGFRIELGEIEAALARHPAVRECAVLARGDGPGGETRLVAYVIARAGGEAADPDAMRSHLGAVLPEYMVPSAFVALEALPLTPNGKLDRSALPAPDASAARRGYAAPATATEGAVAAVFAEVLGVERVGAQDHFFDLGGHSLMATRVISRLRASLGAEIPLRAVFEAPTVSQLAARMDAARQGGATAAPPLVRAVRDDGAPAPLSFAQERLWFLDQLEPGSSAYNVPGALRLDGALDVAALSSALNAVVARHEALRTTFALVDGAPVQRVAPAVTLPLPVEDLSSSPDRESRVRALVDEMAWAPFDLSRGPLVRASLARLGPEAHVLAFCMHHTVSDAWSMGVLVREIAALYRASARGGPSPLPPLPIQYGDYAAWQREWLRGEALDRQLAYWKQHLAGAPAALEFPTDRPRPAVATVRGALASFSLPRPVVAQLTALSRAEDATLFMTLLGAWGLVLGRWSRQRNVVVGTPIANRTRLETENLIGFFANTLALHVDITGERLTFRSLVRRVRALALGAYAHQDLPFEKLVAVLAHERDPSRSPVFQNQFILQNDIDAKFDLPGLRAAPVEGAGGSVAKFELVLSMFDQPGQGLGGVLVYNTDLFDATTADRLLASFRTLLEAVAADPDGDAFDYPLLDERERARVLRAWNDTARALSGDGAATVHGLFAAQVARAPEARAVVAGGEALTFRELNARANRLAHHLRALGVAPDTLVALCLPRSIDVVAAMLAVLKAGGGFVPLDPSSPPARLAFMLDEPKIIALVTDERLADELPAQVPHLVLLDTDAAAISARPDEDPAPVARPDDLAYVIYTSGSTGRPKGVMVAHRGVCNLARAQAAAFEVGPGDRVLQFATVAFDAAVSEVFVTLLAGGCLHLWAPRDGAFSERELHETLRAEAITEVTLPPAVLRVMREDGLPALRTVVAAGESCPAEVVSRFGRARRFLNAYGPTEVTVCATIHACDAADPAPPPIGRPIENTRTYVLDARLRPVPVGVVGEIYVAGVGLARGYLSRPDLTAERFLPDPFSDEGGARLYATGDLARWRADGALEYFGRADGQVKVRGYRVELGEVEAALSAHPGVAAAAVVVREDAPGERRLVAYVVPADADADGGEGGLPRALREHLATRLPEYMVPSAFVPLDALPRTLNGKLDRSALPAPGAAPAEVASYVEPSTPTELAVAGIFGDVLQIERVGAGGNFFELGGHSLLATRVVARVRDVIGVEISVRSLFDAPTVAQLAARIDVDLAVGGNADEVSSMLGRLDDLSDEEVEALLRAQGGHGGRDE